jgi:hypothetical protein
MTAYRAPQQAENTDNANARAQTEGLERGRASLQTEQYRHGWNQYDPADSVPHCVVCVSGIDHLSPRLVAHKQRECSELVVAQSVEYSVGKRRQLQNLAAGKCRRSLNSAPSRVVVLP